MASGLSLTQAVGFVAPGHFSKDTIQSSLGKSVRVPRIFVCVCGPGREHLCLTVESQFDMACEGEASARPGAEEAHGPN